MALRRGGEPKAANALLVQFDVLRRFALNKSVLRLKPLRYALSDDRAFVTGAPLPPLPGARYHLADAVAMPLGYEFAGFTPPILKAVFGLRNQEMALILTDGCWERMPVEAFVPLSRGSVRLSGETSS